MVRTHPSLGIAILVLVVGASCAPRNELTGAYLGQHPPGVEPELFAPGVISTRGHERAVAFSPEGDELFFQKRGREFTTVLVHMQRGDDIWAPPEMAPFSGVPEHRDDGPSWLPDGKAILFSSRRPVEPADGPREDYDLWSVQKSDARWEAPENLGPAINTRYQEADISVAANGNLYFSSNRPREDGTPGGYDIYRAAFVDGQYGAPELLSSSINSEHFEGHSLIAPDESYLIFSSSRPEQLGDGDLFVAFRDTEGNWSEPLNMGKGINSPYHEAAPTLSPDGMFLFFCNFRLVPESSGGKRLDYGEMAEMLDGPGNGSGDVYWVSTKVIDRLRSESRK